MTVRSCSCHAGPVDTGPVQFGHDRPGLYISAFDALSLAMALQAVMRHSNAQSYHMAPVMGLLRQLQACNPRTGYHT